MKCHFRSGYACLGRYFKTTKFHIFYEVRNDKLSSRARIGDCSVSKQRPCRETLDALGMRFSESIPDESIWIAHACVRSDLPRCELFGYRLSSNPVQSIKLWCKINILLWHSFPITTYSCVNRFPVEPMGDMSRNTLRYKWSNIKPIRENSRLQYTV